MADISSLEKMRQYFKSGSTRSYDFRKQQLKMLKAAILKNEEELYDALYADLKKAPEETWVTEIGIVITEINLAIKKLAEWMEDISVSTNLVNLPSRSKIINEPLGVVLIIGPWNYPFQLLINPIIGAIAAGNCVVLKPSEFAPGTARAIKKIIEENFSPDYILYQEGEGNVVIPKMMNNFIFDHVFFTGSTAVGKIIYKMAAENLVPVTLELGGKSPCIVESDANVKVAARRIAVAKFSNAGQMCIAPDYILVHQSQKQALIEALKKAIDLFFTTNPVESYNYCKIINTKQFVRISSYLNEGTIVHGGKIDKEKLYIEPTIMTDIKTDHKIMQEEIFGPVLPVFSFNTMEDAMAIINKNPNPLSFYVYSGSSKKANNWIAAVPAGGACINNSSWHFTNHHLPFGGRGFSGIGVCHGKYSFDTFSHKKAVMKTPTWFDPAIKYPPFKGKLKLFKKVIK